MAVISCRLSDTELKYAEKFAKFEGINLSAYVRELIEREIEEYEDLKTIEKYEQETKNNPNRKLYTHSEVWG